MPNGATNSSKQVYSLTGDSLSLEASNSLPDGSMSQVRTATYVKYTPVPMPAPTSHPAEPGYTSLFNGKDLTGWKASGNPDSFKVENGAIIANAVGGASHLFYDGAVGNHSFTNFDLRLDVLARYRSNGGVYVMTEFQPQGFPGKGFEIQVNNSHSDRIRTGSLYHIVDLSNIPGKDDEWIPMQIMGQGNTITDHGQGPGGRPLDAAGRLAKQLRHAQPQDRPRHDRVSVTRHVQRDRLLEHPDQAAELALPRPRPYSRADQRLDRVLARTACLESGACGERRFYRERSPFTPSGRL